MRSFYSNDIRPLLQLAIPLTLTGLVESSIGFFSTLFLSHLGKTELAAGALVAWLFATMMVILWGSLTAVSVVVSQKHGAKNHFGVSMVLRDSLVLACLLVPPAFLLLWNIAPFFLVLGQTPAIVVMAQSYLHALAWGLLPDFVMLVLLQFMVGLGHVRASMVFTLIWVPIAIVCNYVLIFGKFGFPALGIAGIGWGMTASYWLTTVWLLLYIVLNKDYRHYTKNLLRFKTPFHIWEILRIGLPMGAMYAIEIGFFLVLSLMMGALSQTMLAANQIVLQYLGQLMAVIFSIAQAVTIRMGHLLGAHEVSQAKRASQAGIFIAVLFMTLVSLVYWIFPHQLISLDLRLSDPANATVIHFATQFFVICALFQLLEAARIVYFGSLRALRDTHFTLLVSIVSFWGIALPAGYFLSHGAHLNGAGLWWGMVIGASFSVPVLYYRVRSRLLLAL